MSQLRLENVSKQYVGALVTEPLKSIDLTVNTGDFISITGDSGIGKSTLLYVIGGLINPTTGKVYYNDRDISTFSKKDADRFRAKSVSVIFQDFQFVQAVSLKDNLVIASLAGVKPVNTIEIKEKVNYYLERLDLIERRDFLPSQLSGGQKRRAMVLAGVLRTSEFILADEPTNDTDSRMASEIMKILTEQIEKGRAIIIVSHNRDIADYADTEYTLSNGQLIKNIIIKKEKKNGSG